LALFSNFLQRDMQKGSNDNQKRAQFTLSRGRGSG
jgi:hypothetical protein